MPGLQESAKRPPLTLVSAPFDFPKEEEKIIQFWREIDAFQTSVKLTEGKPVF